MNLPIIVTEEHKRDAYKESKGYCCYPGCRKKINGFKKAKFSHWEWHTEPGEKRIEFIKVYCYACHGWVHLPGMTHLDLEIPPPKKSILPVIPLKFEHFKY